MPVDIILRKLLEILTKRLYIQWYAGLCLLQYTSKLACALYYCWWCHAIVFLSKSLLSCLSLHALWMYTLQTTTKVKNEFSYILCKHTYILTYKCNNHPIQLLLQDEAEANRAAVYLLNCQS